MAEIIDMPKLSDTMSVGTLVKWNVKEGQTVAFGDILGDLSSRRGLVQGSELRGNTRIIRALVPLAETFGYTTDIRSMTQGRAAFSMEFDHYERVPASVADEISKKTKGAGA